MDSEYAPSASTTRSGVLINPSASLSKTESAAAETIQRNYRGYRERRQLNGLGLDASSRWVEAVKEAQYRNSTRPRTRRERSEASVATDTSEGSSLFAQTEWRRLNQIARRVNDDDTSDTTGNEDLSEVELAEHRRKTAEAKLQREQNAKTMGLEYFLELVDQHHRYGSHLRSYHAVWKTTDTFENFFYWLDEGKGKHIDAPTCSRYKLNRDKVRYLSKEQRLDYLVKVDKRGRLRWAKNDECINTNNEYRDSLRGIVRREDPTPTYRDQGQGDRDQGLDSSKGIQAESSSEASYSGNDHSDEEEGHYLDLNLTQSKAVAKVHHVSAAALFNNLLQSPTKKEKWIFVADTSFRLYIGIKQSGAFQHSSFLHGARISAAGLIKVKDGQLRSLAPLSGHYRPPTANFHAFVKSLTDHGVDLSRVSISRSYAILLGLEGYLKMKKRTKGGVSELERQMEKILQPEKAHRKKEQARDKSISAQKEKEWLDSEKAAKKSLSWRNTPGRTFSGESGPSRQDLSESIS